jgi:hypothetical protein
MKKAVAKGAGGKKGNTAAGGSGLCGICCNCFAVINVIIFAYALRLFVLTKSNLDAIEIENKLFEDSQRKLGRVNATASHAHLDPAYQTATAVGTAVGGTTIGASIHTAVATGSTDPQDYPCDDPVWCDVNMPSVSYYQFDPPTDKLKWRLAQIQAANGEQVLLSRISKVFPQPFDFLDGDRSFRRLHYMIDVFVDSKHGLQPLKKKVVEEEEDRRVRLLHQRRRLQGDSGGGEGDIPVDAPPTIGEDGVEIFAWEKAGKKVVPEPYIYR